MPWSFPPAIDRFWARVKKTKTCWLWQGPLESWFGRGNIRLDKLPGEIRGAHVFVHRFSWMIHNGPIPEGIDVCHTCDVAHCVRPDHLFLGTQADNNADMVQKGRQCKGSQQYNAKLKEKDIPVIRRLGDDGLSEQKIANLYDVSQVAISCVLLRKTWKHVA